MSEREHGSVCLWKGAGRQVSTEAPRSGGAPGSLPAHPATRGPALHTWRWGRDLGAETQGCLFPNTLAALSVLESEGLCPLTSLLRTLLLRLLLLFKDNALHPTPAGPSWPWCLPSNTRPRKNVAGQSQPRDLPVTRARRGGPAVCLSSPIRPHTAAAPHLQREVLLNRDLPEA